MCRILISVQSTQAYPEGGLNNKSIVIVHFEIILGMKTGFKNKSHIFGIGT